MATQIYLGLPPPNVVKWIKENYKPDMTKVPLHFTAEQDGSSVSLVCYDGVDAGDFIDPWCKFDYSMDGKTWNTYIDQDNEDETLHRGKVINLNKDETVYFRATLGDVEGNPNLNGFSREYGMKYHYFVMEGSIKADGNIQFLLENTGTKMDVPNECYCGMFKYCTNLTQAPVLPATTLAEYCYSAMFQDCSALTQAPELPATTLANDCYNNMFSGCTSLTQAPVLPATSLANSCYYGMFNGCTNLNNINVNFSAWNPSSATTDWVLNVSSSGTFTCPADLPEEFGNNRIPTGWTVIRK